MKVGDLVEPSEVHILCGESWRAHGVVVEHYPPEKGFSERAVVRWNNGDVELELPMWLEIASEFK